MSDNADYSIWSNDEVELLEYIEKDTKLVSSGSDSDLHPGKQSNGELWKSLQKNETVNQSPNVRQSDANNSSYAEFLNQNGTIHSDALKSNFANNDLSKMSIDNPLSESVPKSATPFPYSLSCNNLPNNEKNQSSQKKRDHVEIKHYFKSKSCDSLDERKVMNEEKDYIVEVNKEEYLEEINKILTKELEEKTALLTKLQENYENLLLKYAEAQNKIDQLRLKTVCESAECQTHSIMKQNFARTNLQLPMNIITNNKEHQESWEDVKCQKAVVAPFMKDNFQEKCDRKIDRPTSLPLDPNSKMMVLEREAIKAATPTDSEGVSSVITSMSGHSKILNTLDVHSPNGRDLMSYPDRDYIRNENSIVNDAFDKVKNWQNSLPPLELIETPETTLYDESPMHISPSNYRLPSSPKDMGEDEALFPSPRNSNPEPKYKEELKDYRRPSSTPRKNNPLKHQKRQHPEAKENAQKTSSKDDIPSSCIIQRRRKKPPLLRCSSLPAYDYDSPRSANRHMYIPPLDLENLTLSDVESSQVECDDCSKGNRGTSSSYITSQSGSVEFTQTHRSMNHFFRNRLSEYTESPYSVKTCYNKSTSISPERCNDLVVPSSAKSKTEPTNTCNVCGEKLGERESSRFPCRSNSYQSFEEVRETTPKSSDRRGKYPFNRSVSFNSETNRRCYHTVDHRRSHDSLEKFDIYTNNLKARSQVIMKALAAHVNNA